VRTHDVSGNGIRRLGEGGLRRQSGRGCSTSVEPVPGSLHAYSDP